MSQMDRLYRLKSWFDSGRCVSREFLLAQLEVSPATLKRDLSLLRDRLNAPVVWDREQAGYRLDRTHAAVGPQYELPGLWFSADEIHALLMMQDLLRHLDAGGLLGPHIDPLMRRLTELLGSGMRPAADVARRIRVQTVGSRKLHLPYFQRVGGALLRRQRLGIVYRGRGRAVTLEREVSPQRLIHYKDNWYLDAWCHLRDALRSFSVDAIEGVTELQREAIEVPEEELDAVLGSGYGIFAGKQVQWASLRFSAERARWVADETWHPQQRGSWDAQGRWLLELPYADPRELVMDILRHAPEVEVRGPEELVATVRRSLSEGLRKMGRSAG